MNRKSKKAQMFSPDIILAFVVFLLIVLTIIVVWEHLDKRQNNVEVQKDMTIIAKSVAEMLVSSSGDPVDWETMDINSSTINSIGLAKSPYYISRAKVEKLENDTNNYYEEMKKILGIRGSGYEFQAQVQYDPGNYTLLGSNPVIGYTYALAEDGASEGDYDRYGIRGYLDKNDIEYTNYFGDWETLLEEIDDFNIVIFEDPHLDDDKDLTNEQETILQDWVYRGNTFIQKEHGNIMETFGLKHNFNAEDVIGTVVATEHVLFNLELGDEVICKAGYRLNKASGNIVSLVVGPSGHPMIGYSYYGNGSVYYLCDTEGDVLFNTSSIVQHDNIRKVINFGGGVASINFGKEIVDAEKIIRIQRNIIMEDYGPSKLVLKVWKNESYRK